MLSLGNAFSEEDLINFEKRIQNYLSIKNDFKRSLNDISNELLVKIKK